MKDEHSYKCHETRGGKMVGKFLIRHWLTILMLFVCLALAVWAWLAYQDALTGLQLLGLLR
jgi:DNA-binding transcriptional regulator of glucitol operon